MAGEETKKGAYAFFTCSKEIKKISKYSFDQEALLLTVGGKSDIKYYFGKFDAMVLVYVLSLEKKFIYWLFEALNKLLPFFEKMAKGTTIPRLSIEAVRNFEVSLPSHNLLDLFNNFAEPIQNQIDSLTKQMDNFQIIKEELIERIYSENLEIN